MIGSNCRQLQMEAEPQQRTGPTPMYEGGPATNGCSGPRGGKAREQWQPGFPSSIQGNDAMMMQLQLASNATSTQPTDQMLATTSVTVQAAEPRGSSRPVALQSLHCLTMGARNIIMAKRCSRASANGLARAPRSCDDLASVITKKGRPMEKPWRRNEGQGRAPFSRALTLH
jgi:hypothetical protein